MSVIIRYLDSGFVIRLKVRFSLKMLISKRPKLNKPNRPVRKPSQLEMSG